jgi:hypothetical protein
MGPGREQQDYKLAVFARWVRRPLTSPLVAGLISVLGLALTLALLAFGDPLAAGIVVGSLILVGGSLYLYGQILRDKVGGVFEVVHDVHEWEILDHSGQNATMTRVRNARVLQDELFAIRDFAGGPQGTHVNPRCRPWKVVHRQRALDQTIAIIALDDVKNRDDPLDYSVIWDLEGVFVDLENWVESVILYETLRMTMRVIFPSTRAPLSAFLIHSNSSEKRVELPVHRHGEKAFKVERDLWYPKRHGAYRIAWEWAADDIQPLH